jgi:hypothetical protein
MKNHERAQNVMLAPQRTNSRQKAHRIRLSPIYQVLAVYILLLIVFVLIWLQEKVSIDLLFRDTLAITGGRFYFGLFSNLGILLWCAASVICLFSFLILKRLNYQYKWQSFLFASGCLILMLLLDDFFLLHEWAFPIYLGVSANVVIGLYGILTALYLLKFYKVIFKTNYKILVLALAFMAASLFVDLLSDFGFLDSLKSTLLANGRIFLIEDGLKFFGILTWLIYFAQLGLQQVQFAALQCEEALPRSSAGTTKR